MTVGIVNQRSDEADAITAAVARSPRLASRNIPRTSEFLSGGQKLFSLTLVFLGVCTASPPLLLAALLVAGMALKEALLAILWSSVIATPACW